MKTTVDVPDGLFREAKAYAARNGMPVREVFELGLRLVLEGAARCCIQADRTISAPYGLFGGKSAARTRYSIVRRDGQVDVIGGTRADGSHASAKRAVWVYAGEALRIEAAGGGGYGHPRERDRWRVRDDVADGYVSPEAAGTEYEARQ